MCVLVVEDELLIRMALAMSLEDAGHEVMCAADGAEAVALSSYHPQRFSAVVTDFHMPGGLNGVDVVRHFRADYPGIPMLIATANPEAVTEELRRAHAVVVVQKPYEPEVVAVTIGQALGSPRGR